MLFIIIEKMQIFIETRRYWLLVHVIISLSGYLYISCWCIATLLLLLDFICFSLRSFYSADDSGGECGVPYMKRFPMPRASSSVEW